MEEGTPQGQVPDNKQPLYLIIALCTIAASTMIVEVVLIKFIAFKVFHHFINIIISMVVLSFAAAGTFLYMRGSGGNAPKNVWQAAANNAAIYSITLMLSVLLFCWIPIDPYNADLAVFWRLLSLPIYLALFACPFFFGGLCISRVLAESRLKPSRVLLFDLAAAAGAAALAPTLIDTLGGYAAIGTAAMLGFVAYLSFARAAGNLRLPSLLARAAGFLVSLVLLLAYPGWATSKYGIDIISCKGKNLGDLITHEFHGLSRTYWNALARIDVSNVGWSNDRVFFYDFREGKDKLEGRIITVDKGANTRQFVNKGKLADQKMFGDSIVSIPYVACPNAHDVLVIGGGGGIDITVAKYFNIPSVNVLEMNPMTYKHVLLGVGDPQKELFQPWIKSDDKTKVSIFNKEARHFCSSTTANSYDVIQATGVDTFTAVASGALAYSDNYLYTLDAIKSYVHLLKPGGVLSLAYCREPVALPARLFVTYLTCLEGLGNKEPWRNIVVVGGNVDVDLVVKTTPFTDAELTTIRQWCERTGYAFIFDPGRRTGSAPGVRPSEDIYSSLAFTDTEKRQQIISSYDYKIEPATDDRPFYYQIYRNESWLFSSDYAYTPVIAIVIILLFSLGLIFLPMKKMRLNELSPTAFGYAAFFAMCGFAYLFFEVAIIQLFTVFIGGPAYALAVVLVSVLAGYAIGCFIVGKLPKRASTFVATGAALFIANLCAWLFLPGAVTAMLVLDFPTRVAACSLITLTLSCLAGLPVPLAMEMAKKAFKLEIAWFWGINCAFNALGAACFPLISFQIGISATLAMVGTLYLVANMFFALLCARENKAVAMESQAQQD